jgi:hypothetical protein
MTTAEIQAATIAQKMIRLKEIALSNFPYFILHLWEAYKISRSLQNDTNRSIDDLFGVPKP